MNAVLVHVRKILGLKQRKEKAFQDQVWKRRIQRDINEPRKTVRELDRYAK